MSGRNRATGSWMGSGGSRRSSNSVSLAIGIFGFGVYDVASTLPNSAGNLRGRFPRRGTCSRIGGTVDKGGWIACWSGSGVPGGNEGSGEGPGSGYHSMFSRHAA